jgi:hypothetical protein
MGPVLKGITMFVLSLMLSAMGLLILYCVAYGGPPALPFAFICLCIACAIGYVLFSMGKTVARQLTATQPEKLSQSSATNDPGTVEDNPL